MSLVTIIMPCGNSELFIRDAINSIIAQTISDWKLIVVNNHSTDDSLKIVRSIHDQRIHFLGNSGVNFGEVLNKGIEKASGEFVILASANDVWEPGLIESQITALIENNADISFCSFTGIDKKGKRIATDNNLTYFKNSFTTKEELYLKFFALGDFLLPTGVILKRSLFPEHGSFDNRLYYLQCFEFWIWLTPHCKIIHLSKCLVRYRVLQDVWWMGGPVAAPDIAAEYQLIYGHFFDHSDRAFVKGSFGHIMEITDDTSAYQAQVENALLLMTNRLNIVQSIGLEHASHLMEIPAAKAIFKGRFEINEHELQRLSLGATDADPIPYKKGRIYIIFKRKKSLFQKLKKRFNLL